MKLVHTVLEAADGSFRDVVILKCPEMSFFCRARGFTFWIDAC